MLTISVVNQKGGCGKTTTAVNLAAALAERKKVALLDLDPQSNASYHLGIKKAEEKETTYEIFDNLLENKELNVNDFIKEITNLLYLIPSCLELSTIEARLAKTAQGIDVLNELKESLQSNFDYLIIDSPPNLGFLTLNALRASDFALIPINIDIFSLEAVKNVEKIVSLMGKFIDALPSLFYLITLFDRRSSFSKNFVIRTKELLKQQLFETIIRNNIYLREAATAGKDIFRYMKRSNGARDYLQLAQELEEKIKHIKAVGFSYTKEAKQVTVAGDFNGWALDDKFSLIRKDNLWYKKLYLPSGKYRYKFVVDGRWIHDENNPLLQEDNFGGYNSLLILE